MKTLLKFSFKRRFLNKMTLFLQIMFIVVITLMFYFDKVSDLFNLEFNQPIPIYIEPSLRKLIINESEWESKGFILSTNKDSITISKHKDVYTISLVEDMFTQSKIYELLLDNHQKRKETSSNPSVYKWLEDYQKIEVNFLEYKQEENQFKHQLIILFLTSIYFMLLNFIAVNSNEIIMEKTSHMIPIILTHVKIRTHFISKLIIGFSSVLFQILSSLGVVGLIAYSRYQLDRGEGLIKFLVKFLPFKLDSLSLDDIFNLLDLSWNDFNQVVLGLVFILLGIFIIQILILILSSKVKTMEEAASIQGPFYLILLIIYYLALSLNTTQSLSSGFGYILSFIPIFSMLIMPMRLLTQHVMPIEIMTSLLFSFALISLIFILMYPLYKEGIREEG
ncbi:MAG: ABC transporter permease [Erysipelotrichaceae bacterium]